MSASRLTPSNPAGSTKMPPDEPADPLLAQVVRYSHIFASAVREILEEGLLREICPHPLTVAQFHLLRLLSLNGLHQVGEAAGFLGISPPAATKNIDKLEALGLVNRRRSRGDRRATLLAVSPKGRRLVKAHEALAAHRFREAAKQLSPQQLRDLSGLLERMVLALFHSTKPEDGFCLRCAAYIDEHCPISSLIGGCTYQEMRRARIRQGEAKSAG